MNYKTLLYELYKEAEKRSDLFYQLDALGKERDKDKFISLLIKTYDCDYETVKIVADHFFDGTPLPSKPHTLSPEQITYKIARECHDLMDEICKEADEQSELYNRVRVLVKERDKDGFISLLIKTYNCDYETVKIVADHFFDHVPLPCDLSPEQIAYNNAIAREWQNKPKCPTCGSEKIKKISTTAKVAGAAMFGLFSKTAKSQFKCEICGYKW